MIIPIKPLSCECPVFAPGTTQVSCLQTGAWTDSVPASRVAGAN